MTDTKHTELHSTSINDRITPIDQQTNPSLASAVESDEKATGGDAEGTYGLNRKVDTIAARGDVPDERTPGKEVVVNADEVKKADAKTTAK